MPNDPNTDAAAPTQQEALLKEIRDFREYAEDRWRKIREESQIDRRYICGDPWDPKDRKAREDAGRPCINHDELGQYVNQAVNNVRANKRGIKVEPDGGGATEETAELKQGLYRGVEVKSKGQQAYITAFQHMVEGSYGFYRISRQYVNDEDDDQEIVIKPIMNQDSVLYDPDCKEADWSDARKVLVLDVWQKSDFQQRWPNAKCQSYADPDSRIARYWINEKTVVVAEYWKVEVTLEKNQRNRQVERKRVTKYLTNGVDILETEPLVTADGQPMGKHIPIIPMFGPQRYLDEGSGPEVKMFSLVRLARDPQMTLAFLVSQQTEEAGLAPKIPAIGYEGQFDTKTDWEHLHKIPQAYAEVKATTSESSAAGVAILPIPQFQQFTPNTVAYEAAKESARRAVQAATGSSPLPTAAQRQNEKSGKALERIQQAQQIGTFHFNDTFENALEFGGRVIDSWAPFIYDTPREIALQTTNDKREVELLNPELLQQGRHGIQIVAGPSNESQREAAGEFLDAMVSNLQNIPQPGTPPAKLLAKAIRMKQLGPIGDEMADILDPQQEQEIPPQALQAIEQSQQQVQVMGEVLKQYQAELAELKQKMDAKVVENDARKAIEEMKIQGQLALEEMKQNFAAAQQEKGFLQETAKELGVQLHEENMTAATQEHESSEAEASRQHEAAQADQQRAHESVESAESRATQERTAAMKKPMEKAK